MNTYCKCGNRLTNKDYEIDPTGNWCLQCWESSQEMLDDWKDNNE